jgi:hypothetical protein
MFYVVRTVHFEMKLYNNQRNAQVFLIYFLICFCLTCFGLSLSLSSEAGVQTRQWFKSAGYGVSATATAEIVHLPLKMGLKKARKHVRQK